MHALLDNTTLVFWVVAASSITFVATLIAVPLLIVRIPADYFAPLKPVRPPRRTHPIARFLLLVARNTAGGVLILLGVMMLVLPGQGLLTIMMGLVLVNVPGKYRAERWLVSRRPVLRTCNWLRRRAGRPPLNLG